MAISRPRVGAFGCAFHASMMLLIVILGRGRGETFSWEFWGIFFPSVLVAAFAVYALLVFPYAARRVRRRGVVLYDSAVAMLAEVVIAVATSLLVAAVHAAPSLRDAGVAGYAGALAQGTLYGLMWAASDFFLQILLVGNAAGLAGWYMLERAAQRGQRAAPRR